MFFFNYLGPQSKSILSTNLKKGYRWLQNILCLGNGEEGGFLMKQNINEKMRIFKDFQGYAVKS
jgi:hypothetical protein